MPNQFDLQTVSWKTIDLTNNIKKVQNSKQAEKTALQKNDPNSKKKVCSELASLFIDQLFKQMRATIPKSELMGGGKAEEIYTSMQDSQLAKEIALKEGFGLSSLISKQLEKQTE